MDIVVKGRRTEVSERFRQHVVSKVGRVERFGHKIVRVDVELIHEANPRLSESCERVELTCRSRGPIIRAEAAGADPYTALDLACSRLEERMRRAADRRRVHHGSRTPVSVAAALASCGPDGLAAVDAAPPAPSALPEASTGTDQNEITERFVVAGEGPLVVREKTHHSAPVTVEQALLEMELVGHDFYLFWDVEHDLPSVVYRRRGYDYGVIRLRH